MLSFGREIADKCLFLVSPLQSMDLRAATGGIFFPNLTGKLRVLGKEGPTLSIFFFFGNKTKLSADGAHPASLKQHPNTAEKLAPLSLQDSAQCS